MYTRVADFMLFAAENAASQPVVGTTGTDVNSDWLHHPVGRRSDSDSNQIQFNRLDCQIAVES
jgi:hypothetical protein